jgi:hypothetical protein
MIPLSRPRPAPINIFAAAFLTAALLPFLYGITNLGLTETRWQADMPDFAWSRDRVIITLSAGLSIALIPIAAVWLAASNVARWLVSFMTLAKLPGVWMTADWALRGDFGQAYLLVSFAFAIIAVGMLFTSASSEWFARAKEVDPAVFE